MGDTEQTEGIKGLLRDLPIQDAGDERLGLKTQADAIAEFIAYCDTPLTIGIQGDWGIGKTSLLNMITKNLEKLSAPRKKLYPVKIETWQYSQFTQEEYLAISVLDAINRAILDKVKDSDKKQELKDNNKKLLGRVWRAVAIGANDIIKKETGLDLKKTAEEVTKGEGENQPPTSFEDLSRVVEEYKRHFKEIVNSVVPDNYSKIVIMLDDLDRLKPVRALELLESVKNFLDVEKTVFILAVDYSVIQKGVRMKMGGDAKDFAGKSFFDKIIQIPFNMPTSSYRIDRYVMALMGWEWSTDTKDYKRREKLSDSAFLGDTGTKRNLSQEDADYFTDMSKLGTNNNPRAIKRVINYANLLKLIYRKNRRLKLDAHQRTWTLREAKIVFGLATIHLTWPEVFYFFAQEPTPWRANQLQDVNFLANIPEARPIFERSADPLKTQSRIAGAFNILMDTIDENDDGEISTNEFRPIWEVLISANLTNVRMESIEDQFDEFRQIVEGLMGKNRWDMKMVKKVINGFLKTDWNNPLYFRLIEAGKHVRTLVWDKKAIGSITTKKSEALELYLLDSALGVEDVKGFIDSLDEALKTLLYEQPKSHYGMGNIQMDLYALAAEHEQDDVNQIMNDLLGVVKKGLRNKE